MIQLLAPLSLIDTSKTATGQSLKDLNRLVRQAHCEASDKLHYLVLSDPVFISYADASWANRKDVGSQCGYLCVGTEEGTVGWERRTLLSHFLAFSASVPELHVHLVLLRLKLQHRRWKRPEFIRLLWLEIVQGGYDDTIIDQEIFQPPTSHH